MLECNPRFWMQHALFIDFYENCLLKKYLGRPVSQIEEQFPSQKKIWVYSLGVLAACLRGDVKPLLMLQRFKRERALVSYAPDWKTAWQHLGRQLVRKVRRR